MVETMGRTSLRMGAGRWRVMVACLPLMLLMGCPQSQNGAPGKTAPQATAPAVGVGPEGVGARPASAPGAPRTTEAQVVDTANSRKAQDLISQAERAYASGVNNYRAGHLDAA